MLKRDTHPSSTDPEARLFRKSRGERFRLTYFGHAVMENRNGLIVASTLTQSSTTAERSAAGGMLQQVRRLFGGGPMTVGADKAYHERDFIDAMRELNIEAHVAAYRRKRVDMVPEPVRSSERYRESQSKRRWIERCFAWGKGPAGYRQTKFRGTRRVRWSFQFAAGVFDLIRMLKLAGA